MTRFEVWNCGVAASLVPRAGSDTKRKEAHHVPGLFGNNGELEWALLLPQRVCLLLRSLWGLMRDSLTRNTHTHTRGVHRDWWWCTASVCWGASSALHARRAQWLRLTQRECSAKETAISSQSATTPPLPETVPLCSFWSPHPKDSQASLLMVMLFNVVYLLAESLNVEHLQFSVLVYIRGIPLQGDNLFIFLVLNKSKKYFWSRRPSWQNNYSIHNNNKRDSETLNYRLRVQEWKNKTKTWGNDSNNSPCSASHSASKSLTFWWEFF